MAIDTLSDAKAAAKKYTQIGKAKIGQLSMNKSIDSTYHDLGEEVYDQVSDGAGGNISRSKKVKGQVAKVNELKHAIKNKDKEIKAIKKVSAPPSKTK
ncbi:MAG: hypothetical protein COY19_07510 [Candidatus Marinimicrobia bacterium CG_4_10_14_0_2_um_filter_48_9]|nr:MAG: hypothetical protein COY19_07510 [Candidatus Marinimicrobia bacterium CG_4_10_14_0_2_um_filter_48_9]